jgi:hypothetical protein
MRNVSQGSQGKKPDELLLAYSTNSPVEFSPSPRCCLLQILHLRLILVPLLTLYTIFLKTLFSFKHTNSTKSSVFCTVLICKILFLVFFPILLTHPFCVDFIF